MELAEFRCEGAPFSLSCAVALGSLVEQREILLKVHSVPRLLMVFPLAVLAFTLYPTENQ